MEGELATRKGDAPQTDVSCNARRGAPAEQTRIRGKGKGTALEDESRDQTISVWIVSRETVLGLPPALWGAKEKEGWT